MAKKTNNAPAAPEGVAPVAYAVRVLVGFEEAGHQLKPNQLVVLDVSRAETLEKEGRISADPAGVEWCAAEYPGAPVLDLSSAEAEQEGVKAGEQDPAGE